jgi:hypothetical protein
VEQQITIDNPTQVTLSENDQLVVVNHVKDCWKKGKDKRSKYEEHWKKCERAYNCEMDDIESPELTWQTNLCLPWAYDAVESWYAHMHQTMMPKDDDIFTISGRTMEDSPGAEVMQKDLEHVQDVCDFPITFGKVLKQLGTKNHIAGKVYWKTEKRLSHEWVLDETTGVQRRQANEEIVYNNPWLDVIELENFVFFPIHGDFDKTTRIHETYRYYEDLKAATEAGEAPYFNIKEIGFEDEKKFNRNGDDESSTKYWQNGDEKEKKENCGLNIKEAYIHRLKIGDKVYKNYIATIVNDKTLIRFQPNPYPMGKSPFVFAALNPDGDCLYGYGLLSKGLGILDAANLTFNQKLCEIKIKMHPPHVYWDDQTFNPYNVIMRPGAMVEMSQDSVINGNLRPLMQDLSHIQLAYSEVAELKAEFESVTVPKVVKGLIEAGERTATEINGVQSNASGKQHIQAFHINQNVLKKILELFYLLKYQRIMVYKDPQAIIDVARITQKAADEQGNILPDDALVAQLPKFMPLPQVDIKVVGYQNQIRKQETLQALGQIVPQLIATPAAKYHKFYNLAETTYKLVDLDTNILLLTKEEALEADKQASEQSDQQNQLMVMQEKAKLDIEVMKEQNRSDIEKQKLQLEAEIKAEELKLKELELMLRYGHEAEKMERDSEFRTEEIKNDKLARANGKPKASDNSDSGSNRPAGK